MKVVLFCGGLGARLRSFNDHVPKPLVEIGSRPILWHLMKYYAYFGHRDFVLCLGHAANAIKTYFLRYDECVSNDFVLSKGGRQVELLQRDIDDWRITFVDTGPTSSIGQRLRAVRDHLDGEEVFLANYADGLSDLDLDSYVEYFLASRRTACFLSVAAPHTFHIVEAEPDHTVRRLQAVASSPLRINGGFFAFRKEIFQFIREGEDLVFEPFERLIAARELLAYPYDGFWRNMDTFKDQQHLEALLESGAAPWQVWRAGRAPALAVPLSPGTAPGTFAPEPAQMTPVRPRRPGNGVEDGLRRQLGRGPEAAAAAGEGSPRG
jgi:glucose-1-phosphate cytidylyltransferase